MFTKKIIIFGVLIFGMIALVIAIGEGDIITQEQLDSINATTFNIQCQLEDIGQNHIIIIQGVGIYFRNVSCLNIEPIFIDENTNDYLIIRPNHFPNFFISDYNLCRDYFNASYCNDFFTNYLIDSHKADVEAIRNNIRNWQTPEGNSEDTDYEDGFGL